MQVIRIRGWYQEAFVCFFQPGILQDEDIIFKTLSNNTVIS